MKTGALLAIRRNAFPSHEWHCSQLPVSLGLIWEDATVLQGTRNALRWNACSGLSLKQITAQLPIFDPPARPIVAQFKMKLTRRLLTIGAFLFVAATDVHAQVVERPVSFDSAGQVMVMTPYIAGRADLRAPWWPVSGDFAAARLYTVNDSSYVLTVARKSGVVERYTLSVADREAIRAIVSRLPREVIAARNDARNSFIKNQTILGLAVYGPAFAIALGDNPAGATAGYLVVAGGSFFAASEIARRNLISRPQSDLGFNMGHNGALAGWATMFIFDASDQGQAAGAFMGGIGGAALGVGLGRGMTEADAIGAAFGSDIGALIGFGVAETIRGDETCTTTENPPGFFSTSCERGMSDRAEVTIILASGILGYPFGVLYPRNARYHVTPGDINALWGTALLGATTAGAFLNTNASVRTAAATMTTGGVLGIVLGDRFLARPYDHGRTDGSRVTLGAIAGGLIGAGVAALINNEDPSPHLVLGLAAVGEFAGILITEKYLQPGPDTGRPRFAVTFNPAGIARIAARTPGNHSLLNVRF